MHAAKVWRHNSTKDRRLDALIMYYDTRLLKTKTLRGYYSPVERLNYALPRIVDNIIIIKQKVNMCMYITTISKA